MPPTDTPRFAILGATGAVGRELIDLLVGRGFDADRVRLLASPRSAGLEVSRPGFRGRVEAVNADAFRDVDIAFFSAGGGVSREWAPAAVAAGATVIDNSSAFRMDPAVPLVIPEINPHAVAGWAGPGIIANPNCSTILALMAVTPLKRSAGIERMVVSTYQAASGAGAALMAELEQQARDFAAGHPWTTDVSGRQYLFNVFSHDSPVGPDGSNEEESKLVRETHKIWDDDTVRITATCVRVPVLRAHCEAINLTLRSPMPEAAVRDAIGSAGGVQIVDDREAGRFPEPILAAGRSDVLVGRIRADRSQAPGIGYDLFLAGDQLLKGAALNAVQIAELLLGGSDATAANAETTRDA
ncbi:MAG: aspartate-semialdehyde dehydrogenase [Phycisphaerales bacterium]|nr:aspartate-semialdehyde dehydrogenase [Phycisphaerales bacterium]